MLDCGHLNLTHSKRQVELTFRVVSLPSFLACDEWRGPVVLFPGIVYRVKEEDHLSWHQTLTVTMTP
jgi:hypothetical protein